MLLLMLMVFLILKDKILVNNNILGEYYNFDNTNQLISIFKFKR